MNISFTKAELEELRVLICIREGEIKTRALEDAEKAKELDMLQNMRKKIHRAQYPF